MQHHVQGCSGSGQQFFNRLRRLSFCCEADRVPFKALYGRTGIIKRKVKLRKIARKSREPELLVFLHLFNLR
ncbi:hypothetical protein DK44_4202 [Bacillus atrophaeus]|nr:hypothetical protein DK44_4202 [Bacillus atrophaeus]